MYDDPNEIKWEPSKLFGFYGPALLSVAGLILFICVGLYAHMRAEFYDIINEKGTRDATIVDAWPYNTGKHGSGREQWEGTFRDNITGHFYTYEMSGGLFQKFQREKSGHGIPVTVWISPSRAGVPEAENADNRQVAFDLLRIFSCVFSLALLIVAFLTAHTGYKYTKQTHEAEAARERQKQVDRDNYEARTQRNQRGFS